MPTSIGMDLLDVARLERALARRPQIAHRLFTDRELAECQQRARPVMHLAARFCAKEAVVKALRLDYCPWREIEVLSQQNGAPTVHVSPEISTREVAISLTHERTIAGAVAIVC